VTVASIAVEEALLVLKVVFLVLGESKAEAVRKAFEDEPSPETPASLLRSKEGKTIVLLDRAAAAELDNID
jgi:6-phosphogluconolactonase/glucosamine-6-phosphate isomerase/deaminase